MPPKSNQDKGMVNRLKDQLKVQKQVNRIHKNPQLLKEIAFYPEHDKRRETQEYKAVHKKLTQEVDLPCLICGIRNSPLKDKQKNPMEQGRWRLIIISSSGHLLMPSAVRSSTGLCCQA